MVVQRECGKAYAMEHSMDQSTVEAKAGPTAYTPADGSDARKAAHSADEKDDETVESSALHWAATTAEYSDEPTAESWDRPTAVSTATSSAGESEAASADHLAASTACL